MMKEFNIKDFGARACDALQTEKIQSALDACFLAGGGKVIIPKGIFLTGGIRLRSNTTLYLESGAILRGSRSHEDYAAYLKDEIEPVDLTLSHGMSSSVYPFSKWSNGLIKVLCAENVSIIGEPGSFIDGVNCYDPEGEGNMRGPHAINMHHVKNLHLEGYTVVDSANWAHAIFYSENITAKNVTVYGGHDGFDFFACDNILVEDCELRSGDDCIAGYDNKDVVIRNCIFDSACSAIRFGGTNVTFDNCQGIAPASYGFRGHLSLEDKSTGAPTNEKCRHAMHTPFLYYCDFRLNGLRNPAGNIVVKNCRFENPDSIFLHPFEKRWCSNRGLNSIVFENCEILGLSLPGDLTADPNEPIDYRLKNVKISAREDGAEFPILEASNCKYIEFDNVTIEGFKDPHILTDHADKIKITNSTNVKIIENTSTIKAGDLTQG